MSNFKKIEIFSKPIFSKNRNFLTRVGTGFYLV